MDNGRQKNKDTISRQAAIQAVRQMPPVEVMHNVMMIDKAEVMTELMMLPPAEPKRGKGFWYALQKGDKGYSAGDFKCSVCGEPNHTWLPKPKYCPNCGAEMEVTE